MLRRLTGPRAIAAKALARETGVSQSTLSKWLRDSRNLPAMTKPSSKLKSRTPEDKFRLVTSAIDLEGDELGAFLRREGIHEAELQEWQTAMLHGLSGAKPSGTIHKDRQIKELEKELRRKDKALAEAAALALLKKKATALGLLAAEDDDTSDSSGSSL